MKKLNKIAVALAIVAPISFTASAGNNTNGTMQNGDKGNLQGSMMGHSSCLLDANQFQQRTLPPEVMNDLLYMREEEKLARDVYRALYRQTFAMEFDNISQSEQKHMDRVKTFLDAYNIPDPAQDEDGKFTDPALQSLYTELLAQGSKSVLDAYNVGALVEEVDINDLNTAIENTEIEELKSMYGQLRSDSYKHLRAFTRKIIATEGTYTAQVLSQDTVDIILEATNTSMQMGNAFSIVAGDESTSNACFISNLSTHQQAIQNGSTISSGETVSISYQVNVDAEDVDKTADWILLANYSAMQNRASNWFVSNNGTWQAWDGNIANLPASSSGATLQSSQTIPVFEGTLSELPGKYTIYIGYRLGSNTIVYNQFPLVFSVSP